MSHDRSKLRAYAALNVLFFSMLGIDSFGYSVSPILQALIPYDYLVVLFACGFIEINLSAYVYYKWVRGYIHGNTKAQTTGRTA